MSVQLTGLMQLSKKIMFEKMLYKPYDSILAEDYIREIS